MHKLLIISLVAILSFSNTMVYGFESELWPGEGIPVFKANKTAMVNIYDQPSGKIIKRHQIKHKEKLTFSASRFRTSRIGKIKVMMATTVSGISFGKVKYLSQKLYESDEVDELNFSFKTGETFDYLQYRAEGACLVRYKQNVIELEYCAWVGSNNNSPFTLIQEPKNEWWIKTAKGWLLVDENFLDISREF